MYYKVWVQIEKQFDSGRDPENVEEPVEVSECGTIAEARKIVHEITERYTDNETRRDWKARKIFPYGQN